MLRLQLKLQLPTHNSSNSDALLDLARSHANTVPSSLLFRSRLVLGCLGCLICFMFPSGDGSCQHSRRPNIPSANDPRQKRQAFVSTSIQALNSPGAIAQCQARLCWTLDSHVRAKHEKEKSEYELDVSPMQLNCSQ